MKTKADVLSIIAELKKLYPDGICSLDYPKPYELLFSVRLAAQCTDERVNMVTPALFARFPTLESLAEADIGELETYIHSTGFFRAKARDIVGAARMMLDEYGGKVPDNMDDLLKLPGVGRKTANLILGDVYHQPGVVVADTHCIRISGKLGLTDGTKDPAKVKRSSAKCSLPKSPMISVTGWCSMVAPYAWPEGLTVRTVPCVPGATFSRKVWAELWITSTWSSGPAEHNSNFFPASLSPFTMSPPL